MSIEQDILSLGGLLCSIYTSKEFPEGMGKSYVTKSALIVDLENPNLGPFKVGEFDPAPYILVVDRLHRKGEAPYCRAYPLQLIDGVYQVKRGMASGNFLYTTDSRFRNAVNAYPIAIHDRFED